MNILIDTGHPAEIHFFRNIAFHLEKQGHSVYWGIREKDCSLEIAKSYNLKFFSKGKGSYFLLLKLLYFFRAVFILLQKAKSIKPHILISFASPYAGTVAKLLNIPHIIFLDTEHEAFLSWFDRNLSSHIITPSCFHKNLGHKQITVNTYKELAYLNSTYFWNNSKSTQKLKIPQKDFILVRLVNHGALHNIFRKKWENKSKFHFIHKLAKSYSIIISSEISLPENLQQYSYTSSPELLHQIINEAKMTVGESATVATESSVLGVPAILIDNSNLGYVNEIKNRYQLIKQYKPESEELKKAEKYIHETMQNSSYHEHKKRRTKLLNEKIDITAFMTWFIQNYPESAKIMKENPDYQYKFK